MMKKYIFYFVAGITVIAFCYFNYQNGRYGNISILYRSDLPMGIKPKFWSFSLYPPIFCFVSSSGVQYEQFNVWSYAIRPDTSNLDFVAYGYNATSIIVIQEDTLSNTHYYVSQIDTCGVCSSIFFREISTLPTNTTYKWVRFKKNSRLISLCNFIFSFLLVSYIPVIQIYKKRIKL